MKRALRLGRFSVVLALGMLLVAAQGCAYVKHRVEDALDIADIGVSVSIKPCLAFYGCAVGVGSGGYSDVEGHLFGVGGGKIGIVPHYENCWGFVAAGHETHAWGDYSKDDPDTQHRQWVGAVGLALFPLVEARPSYYPTCTHYLHLGYVGFVGNLRYTEMIDFVLGFTTFDLNDDDGKPMARWPWKPGWSGWFRLPPMREEGAGEEEYYGTEYEGYELEEYH